MATHNYETALFDIQAKSTKKMEVIHSQLKSFSIDDAAVFYMVDFLYGKVYKVMSNNLSTSIAFERYFKLGESAKDVIPKQLMVIEKYCKAVNAVRTIYAIGGDDGVVRIFLPADKELCPEIETLSDALRAADVESVIATPIFKMGELQRCWGKLHEMLDAYHIHSIMPVVDMGMAYLELNNYIGTIRSMFN